MPRAHVEEVRTEEVLLVPVAHLHLSHGNEVLVFADIVGKAFVAERIDFTGNNKTVCPNFYEHSLNIKFFCPRSGKKFVFLLLFSVS